MTHDLITASGWQGASLRAIVAGELKPYGARAELVGRDLMLAPHAAQTLGLLLHELATNAAKHGALSNAQGQVSVAWERRTDAGGDRLRLEWREHGGPSVRAPTRAGFGRTLIEGIVAHELKGKARLQFPPAGVRYELEAPWAGVAA
jgi:two-component sensor histidine kinase